MCTSRPLSQPPTLAPCALAYYPSIPNKILTTPVLDSTAGLPGATAAARRYMAAAPLWSCAMPVHGYSYMRAGTWPPPRCGPAPATAEQLGTRPGMRPGMRLGMRLGAPARSDSDREPEHRTGSAGAAGASAGRHYICMYIIYALYTHYICIITALYMLL